MTESRHPFSVDLLLRRAPLPFDVDVVTGYVGERDEIYCLRPGGRLRIHCVRYESFFFAKCEEDQTNFLLPLNGANKLEFLPDVPELDDRMYPTAGDVLQAVPRPKWIRVQESYDGGYDYNTVHDGEEFQNLYSGKTYRGARCMCGTSMKTQGLGGETETEEVRLVLETRGMFTTTRSVKKYLTAADLAMTCEVGDELAVRVRVHCVKKHALEVPQPPIKAKLSRLVERKVAVCTNAHGRVLLLPSSLDTVRLRLRQRAIPMHAEDPATHLYPHMDLSRIPQIGPSPLASIFRPFSEESVSSFDSPACSFKQLAVLFPPSRSALPEGRTQRNTQSYLSLSECGARREVTDPSTRVHVAAKLWHEVKKVVSLADTNLLKRHCVLTSALGDVRRLVETSSRMAVADLEEEDLRSYEQVGCRDDDVYDEVQLGEDTYADVDSRDMSRTYQAVLARHEENSYELPRMRGPLKMICDEEAETGKAEVKLKRVRKENEVLTELIVQRRLQVEKLQNEIKRCVASKRNVEDEGKIDWVKLLQSLTTAGVANLLENLGLHSYMETFSDEGVEGYLLCGCDADYLRDLGMRPAHAQKLLATLKGRCPVGRSLTDLIK